MLGVIGDGILGCHSFSQGPFYYLAAPRGSERLDPAAEIDGRVEWYRRFGGDRELRLFADVFNLTDQSRATEVETIVGPELGQAATENFSRSVRFGLGYGW